MKNAVMLVSGDYGDVTDIHPARKAPGGFRLASIALSRSRMLAPDGRCKFGDARADGSFSRRSEQSGIPMH